tara:strand:+ start:20343 stop:22523 length:2181 start_codon:yes stop_codon:yes gene_type:complete
MPKIPLYQQQIKVSSDTPSVKLDVSNEVRAIGQIADTYAKGINNLGKGAVQMIDNYEKLEEEAAIADANREMIDFNLAITSERNEVLQRDDINLSNYDEKYLSPKIEEQKRKMQSKGYSNKALRKIMPILETDFGNIRNNEKLAQVKVKTQQYVSSITNEASTFLSTNNRQSGIDILDNAVESGFILRNDADKLIKDADKSFFKTNSVKIIDSEDVEGQLQNIDPERWNAMDQLTKDDLIATTEEEIFTRFRERQDTIIKETKILAQKLQISEDEINALEISKSERNQILTIRKNAIKKTKADYNKSNDNVLFNLDNKIKTLFLGKSNNPTEDYETIMKVIADPSLDVSISDHYYEIMEDRIGSRAGYNVFIKGEKNVTVYDNPAEEKAWMKYWQVFDDATTYMPSYERDVNKLTETKNRFLNFLKMNKDAAQGTLELKQKAKRAKNTMGRDQNKTAKQQFDEDKKRFIEDNSLEFDANGILVASPENDAVINRFINKEFAFYRDYQGRSYYDKSVGLTGNNVLFGEKTRFSQYYVAPSEKNDESAISREVASELRNQGILFEVDSLPYAEQTSAVQQVEEYIDKKSKNNSINFPNIISKEKPVKEETVKEEPVKKEAIKKEPIKIEPNKKSVKQKEETIVNKAIQTNTNEIKDIENKIAKENSNKKLIKKLKEAGGNEFFVKGKFLANKKGATNTKSKAGDYYILDGDVYVASKTTYMRKDFIKQ